MAPDLFTLTYEGLAEDCGTVSPENRGSRDQLDEAAVRCRLEAFAAIPSVDLVGNDVRIRLRFGERHIAVTRSGATLFFVQMPEVKNTPVASSPGGVIDFLLGRAEMIPVEPAVAVPEIQAEPEAMRRKALFNLPLGGQIALMAVLASVLVGLIFRQVNSPPPDGYVYVSDMAKLELLHKSFNGRYGSGIGPDALSFVVNGNQLDILANVGAGTSPSVVKSERVRYAMRGETVALIGREGDILEFGPDGSLLFGELSYPRN